LKGELSDLRSRTWPRESFAGAMVASGSGTFRGCLAGALAFFDCAKAVGWDEEGEGRRGENGFHGGVSSFLGFTEAERP
jgi:hypothetical protein